VDPWYVQEGIQGGPASRRLI